MLSLICVSFFLFAYFLARFIPNAFLSQTGKPIIFDTVVHFIIPRFRPDVKNLSDFAERTSRTIDTESYRPFIKSQLEVFKHKNAIAEDNELYIAETLWMDKIRPIEFEEAESFKLENDISKYIERSLEGIARLYSDEAILEALAKLAPDYPYANELAESYKQLMQSRDESTADDKALEKLRKQKESWENDLLNVKN